MSSSESKRSDSSDSSESNSRLGQAQSTATSSPPTSVATTSSPVKSIGSPVVSFDTPACPVEWSCPVSEGKHVPRNPSKRPAEYTLFQNGTRDEDCDLPTKRSKTLKTTWNFATPSAEATTYLNERMLELSRITRRAIAARMRYQRLRSRELDLIRSICVDETELCQTQLNEVDVQIGSIRNMLQVGGAAAIGSTGCRFEPGDTGSWCESSSDEGSIIAAVSRGSSACPSDDTDDT